MGGLYRVAYGLEASSGRGVLVRAKARGGWRVVATGAVDSEEFRSALGAAAEEVSRGRAALALAAPAALTVVRRLRVALASAKKAAKVWPSLLDVELPFPLEASSFFVGESRTDGGGCTAIGAAIRKADLEAFEGEWRGQGVDATHCDAEALALWDELEAEASAAPHKARAVVWLARDHVTLVRGGVGGFMAAHVLRASPLVRGASGWDAFASLWAARMGPVLAAHLSETGASEMHLWWAGPGAEDEALAGRLRGVLPAGGAMRHATVREPKSFLARGLARRAVRAEEGDFKTGEFASAARTAKESRRARGGVLGVAAAAMLLLALNGAERARRTRADRGAQADLMAAARAIAGPSVVPGQEVLMVERALDARAAAMRPFRTAMDPAGAESVLAVVARAASAAGVAISELSLSRNEVSVEGTAAEASALEALANSLRAQGWTVESGSRGPAADGGQRLWIQGTRRNEG
jgi:hypothetical protein